MARVAFARLLFAAASTLSVADKYDDWQRANRDALEFDPIARLHYLTQSYEKDFGDQVQTDVLRSVTISDLHLIYRAAAGITLTTHDARRLQDATRVYDDLAQKHSLSEFEQVTHYRLLVALRRFDAAAVLARDNPSIRFERLPAIVRDRRCCNSSRPQLLSVEGDNRLRLVSAPDASIVVVAHPLCHFTQDAIRGIETDSRLAVILEKSWLWIAPQDGYLTLDAFETWNRAHPRAKMSIAYRQSEWPMPAMWETPTFYFFKNGKIVATVQGWPAEGNLSQLRDGARAAGLDVR